MFNQPDFSVFKKIISYLRVSTGEQQTDAQRHIINQFFAENNLAETHCIEANGVGSKKRYNKRQIDKLLAKATRGSLIVVSELSRLARGGVGETFDIINAIRAKKAYLYVVTYNLMICPDADIATDAMLFGLSMGARIEHDMISQRTKAGCHAAWAAGRQKGSPKAKLKKLNQKKTAAAIVHAKSLAPIIRPLVNQGASQRKIADALNAAGTLTVMGKPWSCPSVQSVLNRLNLKTKKSR